MDEKRLCRNRAAECLFFCDGLGLLLGVLRIALKLRYGGRVVAGLGVGYFRPFHALLCQNDHLGMN